MSAYGIDIEQAERLVNFMQGHSDDVSALAKQVRDRVDSLDWFGLDAERFRAEDVEQILQLLGETTKASKTLSDDARDNLTAQRKTSEL